mgnify:CR=1 FL=1
MSIKKDLNILNSTDLYSLSMFILYKLTDIPEYTTLAELPYIMDKENTLKLCEYFGGRTIKIPTIEELYSIMNILLLYQYVNIDHMDYNKATELIGYNSKDLRKIKSIYLKISEVLDKYDFKSRIPQ